MLPVHASSSSDGKTKVTLSFPPYLQCTFREPSCSSPIFSLITFIVTVGDTPSPT
ncbi:hypothetical protein M378DRAFT_162485 [Amanita muscaria Koide BX008]|uniref:Uncharacterized protein n=1 Tax=Amanita muscaria (strain Koide BX008) TaxID=946122 RepID=A0A0C2X7D9_AMAMK|nr:hypothetical protein M378DRAFT_162485 [Amanita muscaria Koide BX008]